MFLLIWVYCISYIKVIKADMVTESTYVFKLYLFQVISNQIIVEPEGAGLLTPRSTVLSGLELVDTSPKITPCKSQSKRIENESLKTKTVVFTGL